MRRELLFACSSHRGYCAGGQWGPWLTLPCSKGFAMVTSWASCCSQENCASDHFTWSWGSSPWIRKHCGAKRRCDIQLYFLAPQTQEPLSVAPPQQLVLGGLGAGKEHYPGNQHIWVSLAKPLPPSPAWHRGLTQVHPGSGKFILMGRFLWATKTTAAYEKRERASTVKTESRSILLSPNTFLSAV